jgi:membrane protein DedA with SNARE-associated domain
MLLIASISERLVTFAVNTIGDLGLFGVFVLMTAESALIPIPSEATMLFAGFNVSSGHYPLWEPVAVGVAGNLVGSWIAYAIGYFGRIDLVEKHGHFLHITPARLRWTDRWFEKHGEWTVFFSRMVPVIRTFISLPAGVAKMPFWRFTVFTVAGCIPWVLMLTAIGNAAGDNWRHWKHYFSYLDYLALAAIVIGIVYLVVRRRQTRSAETEAV